MERALERARLLQVEPLEQVVRPHQRGEVAPAQVEPERPGRPRGGEQQRRDQDPGRQRALRPAEQRPQPAVGRAAHHRGHAGGAQHERAHQRHERPGAEEQERRGGRARHQPRHPAVEAARHRAGEVPRREPAQHRAAQLDQLAQRAAHRAGHRGQRQHREHGEVERHAYLIR
ncbi:hypothetical protein Adeh_2586 [Anaeromyxobacter dehalogenans 2CP-C]|uniref:Uncharacterized protein n=1 Tax=Anaeromyxobacter dehalogenans (strain 2CP-C) TaxID=290397 RepID=Q2IL23_ANADE|nr:hypothetical protein Adeh_2586 [Anaeromyxobacter dehalogenans 2CP-C]